MFYILLLALAFLIGVAFGSNKGFTFKAETDGLYLYFNSDGAGSAREKTHVTKLIKS